MPKIYDVPLVTFISLLTGWVNANKYLAQNFLDTFGKAVRPIQHITYRVAPNGFPIIGQNTSLPVLAAWRQTDTFKPRTDESRNCVSTIGLKYILPADEDTDKVFAVLHTVMDHIDRYMDNLVETQYWANDKGPDPHLLLDQTKIIEWGNTWDVTYGYEGFDGQTVYPTATAKFPLTTEYIHFPLDQEPPDGIQIYDNLGLFIEYNLKGVGSDGDLSPSINPIVSQLVPEATPSTKPGPPLAPGSRYSLIR